MNETMQTEGAMGSLRAKLDRFVNGLSAEEQAQLRVIPTTGDTNGYSTELTAKVNQTASTITDEEWSALHRLLLSSADADTIGFRVAEYDDGFGDKSRPGGTPGADFGDTHSPTPGVNGGGGAAVGPILLFGAFIFGSLFPKPAGEYP